VHEHGDSAPATPRLVNAHAIKLASYNIHGGVGRDGRCVPRRIVQVLAELNADIVALQEVESGTSGFDMLGYLEAGSGLQAIAGPTLLRPDSEYGNGLLVRFPVLSVRRIDLSIRGYEPRGALDVEVDAGGFALRIVATHLGLRPAERRDQIQRLLQAFERDRPLTSVLMGDINEWFLWGRPLRWLHRHFKATPTRATFPAWCPVFALDRIWAEPRNCLRSFGVHSTPLSRMASDHLPATAELVQP
jgi:endonuclease/exonuclease/phosphatase family metal-dependent hydrolase